SSLTVRLRRGFARGGTRAVRRSAFVPDMRGSAREVNRRHPLVVRAKILDDKVARDPRTLGRRLVYVRGDAELAALCVVVGRADAPRASSARLVWWPRQRK